MTLLCREFGGFMDYKVIATLSWRFDGDDDLEVCHDKVRKQLEAIVDCYPQGEIYDGFSIQVDLSPMKPRNKLEHVKAFDPDEIFSLITKSDARREFVVDGVSYFVKMNSDRHVLFKRNRACVACGLVGTKVYLDVNPVDRSPHFNFYAEENGRLVLMTKDHIFPKSKGGLDTPDNYQTCCSVCNNLKAAYDLSTEDVKHLRVLLRNDDKLPKKELKDLINRKREEFAAPTVLIFKEVE